MLVDTKDFECQTCKHHVTGKCDTWCENGEQYSPNMNVLKPVDAVLDKLKGYEDAEEQGRLVVLPCNKNEWVFAGLTLRDLHKTMYVSQSGIMQDVERGYVIRKSREEAEAALRKEQA